MSAPENYRDLLAADAAFGIGPEDRARLDQLRELECSDYELAAAACHVGWIGEVEQMPSGLRQKLREQASDWSPEAPLAPSPFSSANPGSGPGRAASEPARAPGWMLAAAGLLAAFGAWSFLRGESYASQLEAEGERQAQLAAQELPAARLAALLETQPADLLTLPFQPAGDETGQAIQGEVFWTGSGQEGYMRLTGLAANTPSVEQYQLWIIDGEREGSPPIDGGLFDMPAGGDAVVIPIRAGVRVLQPAAFAVTVESPGGVVVSKQDRVAIVASA